MHDAVELPRLDQYDFHHRISEIAGVSIVCFTSPDCGACLAARHALKRLAGEDKLISVFEVDAVENPALTNEFGFFHLPSLYLYLDGQFHGEIQSQSTPQALKAAVATLQTLPAEEEP